MIYFDHNATTPLLAAAREAWLSASTNFIGNPASQHRLGQRADKALEEARAQLAGILDCDPLQIIWTSGATEASNTVFNSISAQSREAELWVSAIEHPAVLNAANAYAEKKVRFIPVETSGRISVDWIGDNLKRHRPALVAVIAANNETGILQPWRELATLCREHGIPFLCDATQWFGKLPARDL